MSSPGGRILPSHELGHYSSDDFCELQVRAHGA